MTSVPDFPTPNDVEQTGGNNNEDDDEDEREAPLKDLAGSVPENITTVPMAQEERSEEGGLSWQTNPSNHEAQDPSSNTKPQSNMSHSTSTTARIKNTSAPQPPGKDDDDDNKKSMTKAKSNRELNPLFQDVKESGNWGNVSKGEVYAVAVVAAIVVIGVIIGIALAIRSKHRSNSVLTDKSQPTMAPTKLQSQNILVLAFDAINVSDFTYLYQNDLPVVATDYAPLFDDPNVTPQQRAMTWLLLKDTRDVLPEEVGQRWALASIYYSLQGQNWNNATGWLSSQSVCNWSNIRCDRVSETIQEIDLSSNNLVGTIPNEFVMLNTTQAILLNNNHLTGTIPSAALGSMPDLTILYLNNNQLTGTISTSIRNNGVLNSLFVQGNNITGEWPRLFCTFMVTGTNPVQNFGLDCSKISCPQAGCCTPNNCYYD